MRLAYIGIGANLGSREETLRRAVGLLGRADGVEVVAVSELRETDPVGVVDQPPFGRVRGERWGPRIVDLDLLVYGNEVIDEPGLRVPHPGLHERRFVLEPLADLNSELEIPGRGTVSALLAALD